MDATSSKKRNSLGTLEDRPGRKSTAEAPTDRTEAVPPRTNTRAKDLSPHRLGMPTQQIRWFNCARFHALIDISTILTDQDRHSKRTPTPDVGRVISEVGRYGQARG